VSVLIVSVLIVSMLIVVRRAVIRHLRREAFVVRVCRVGEVLVDEHDPPAGRQTRAISATARSGSTQWCIVFTAHAASTLPAATGSDSAAPSVTVIRSRLRLHNRRAARIDRMNGVGSTATTSAPARAASIVPGPIPAPMSTTRSPDAGATASTTAALISDRHI
jgi:hypothetical protein